MLSLIIYISNQSTLMNVLDNNNESTVQWGSNVGM